MWISYAGFYVVYASFNYPESLSKELKEMWELTWTRNGSEASRTFLNIDPIWAQTLVLLFISSSSGNTKAIPMC